jgi:hypothetical protein
MLASTPPGAHRRTDDPRLPCQGSAIALGTAGSVQEVALDAEHHAVNILVIDVVEPAPSANGVWLEHRTKPVKNGRTGKSGIEMNPRQIETDIDIRHRVPHGPGAQLPPARVGVAVRHGSFEIVYHCSSGGLIRRELRAVLIREHRISASTKTDGPKPRREGANLSNRLTAPIGSQEAAVDGCPPLRSPHVLVVGDSAPGCGEHHRGAGVEDAIDQEAVSHVVARTINKL